MMPVVWVWLGINNRISGAMKKQDEHREKRITVGNIATCLSTGFGLYCIVWMVMIVRPEPLLVNPSANAEVTRVEPRETRMMPNPTEREMTKLCSARTQSMTSNRLPAAAWTGAWQGDLGKAIRTGGLRLDWKCFVQKISPIDGILCGTRPMGGVEYALLPLHTLGESSSYAVGTQLNLQKMRQGLAEKEGVVVNIDQDCDIRVVVDSGRFISSDKEAVRQEPL